MVRLNFESEHNRLYQRFPGLSNSFDMLENTGFTLNTSIYDNTSIHVIAEKSTKKLLREKTNEIK